MFFIKNRNSQSVDFFRGDEILEKIMSQAQTFFILCLIFWRDNRGICEDI